MKNKKNKCYMWVWADKSNIDCCCSEAKNSYKFYIQDIDIYIFKKYIDYNSKWQRITEFLCSEWSPTREYFGPVVVHNVFE